MALESRSYLYGRRAAAGGKNCIEFHGIMGGWEVECLAIGIPEAKACPLLESGWGNTIYPVVFLFKN